MNKTRYLRAFALLSAVAVGPLIAEEDTGVSGAVQDAAAEAELSGSAPALFQTLSDLERLGRRLFFDAGLSDPPGQSCASCHDPNFGFTEPDKWQPTSEGAAAGIFGKRNAPTVMYTSRGVDAELRFDEEVGVWKGGLFWDGRAKNFEEQAKQPFLNPLEMGSRAQPDRTAAVAALVGRVRKSGYAGLFLRVFGSDAFADPGQAFDNVAKAIAAFERTAVFGQYTSKFDAVIAGRVGLTELERKGEEVFLQVGCADCHPLRPVVAGVPQPGTDFSYHNIGVPRNPENRFYRMDSDLNPAGGEFIDAGLGGTFPEGSKERTDQWGKHKTPSLRNVALTAPYGHNGYFNTLRGVVDFYSSRDTKPVCRNEQGAPIDLSEELALSRACWPAPEVAANVDREIRGGGIAMGRMGLAPEEIDAVVAFLKTLTDGWRPSLRF